MQYILNEKKRLAKCRKKPMLTFSVHSAVNLDQTMATLDVPGEKN